MYWVLVCAIVLFFQWYLVNFYKFYLKVDLPIIYLMLLELWWSVSHSVNLQEDASTGLCNLNSLFQIISFVQDFTQILKNICYIHN